MIIKSKEEFLKKFLLAFDIFRTRIFDVSPDQDQGILLILIFPQILF